MLILFIYSRDMEKPITKMAFIKYMTQESVAISQHLTNTVFVDRALMCIPFYQGLCVCR